MERLCGSCARLSLATGTATARRLGRATRSWSTSTLQLAKDSSADSDTNAGRPLIRKVSDLSYPTSPSRPSPSPSSSSSSSSPRPVQRRTAAPEIANPLRRPTPKEGAQVLQRRTQPQSGHVLRRTGSSPSTGQLLRRPAAAGAARTLRPGATRPASLQQRKGQQSQGRQPGPDKRRRRAPKQVEDDIDRADLDVKMNAYIAKHVDRPANPTEPLPYNPSQLTLDHLKADWPTTPLSASGVTESVIQKIEWLAQRLPHGYQSPEQIAEHYLKGKLTRFESEEEKQLVLKIAAEMSAKTKLELEEGTLHKHETPRFQIVHDPSFTSMNDKPTDKTYLVASVVKGDYAAIPQQRYPFLQNAARLLNNNESYSQASMQKLLDRVQALVPQTRTATTQHTKKA